MIEHNGTWLASVTIGIPVLITATILLLGLGIYAFRKGFGPFENSYDDGMGYFIVAGVCAVALIAMLALSGFGYYPYKADYHRLQPINGTVAAVDSRFLATSEYLVITYDTGLTVRCDDTRCVTVKAGDHLRLLCTKEYQYGSPYETHGWGCRWGSNSSQ